MLRAMRIVILLCIPCGAGLILWCLLFVHPAFGFREDLKVPFVAVFAASFASACAGAAVVAWVRPRTAWAFLCFFIGVLLLHIFGFLWSLGAVSNAYL